MNLILAVEQLPVVLGWREWGMVALSSSLIFLILGKRLVQDVRRWCNKDAD